MNKTERRAAVAVATIVFAAFAVTTILPGAQHDVYLPFVYVPRVDLGAWAYSGSVAAMLPEEAFTAIVVHWSDIESIEGVYNWSTIDSIVASVPGPMYMSVRMTPEWARSSECTVECCPPDTDNYEDYVDFVLAVISRYDPEYIEVWNEPDVWWWEANPGFYGCWGKTAQCGQDYIGLVDDVYPAVKAVSDTMVVCGALMYRGAESEFAQGMAAANASLYCDAISFHSYPTFDQHNFEITAQRAEYLYSLFPNRPLIVSETSLLDDVVGNTQAEYLSWLLNTSRGASIKMVLWYTACGNGWRYGDLCNRPAWDVFAGYFSEAYP